MKPGRSLLDLRSDSNWIALFLYELWVEKLHVRAQLKEAEK